MKWYWLLLIGTVCCAGDRPAHYPPPAKHPLVEAAHKAAKEKQEEDKKRKSLFTACWKKPSIKK